MRRAGSRGEKSSAGPRALQCGPDVFDVVLNQPRLAVCPKLYGGVSQQVKEGLVDCVHHEVHVARSGVPLPGEKCLQHRGLVLREPRGVAAITSGPKGILRAWRRNGSLLGNGAFALLVHQEGLARDGRGGADARQLGEVDLNAPGCARLLPAQISRNLVIYDLDQVFCLGVVLERVRVAKGLAQLAPPSW